MVNKRAQKHKALIYKGLPAFLKRKNGEFCRNDKTLLRKKDVLK